MLEAFILAEQLSLNLTPTRIEIGFHGSDMPKPSL